jgi:hypothetical protein
VTGGERLSGSRSQGERAAAGLRSSSGGFLRAEASEGDAGETA